MADRRRVSVHLELEIARYLGSAAQAATATRRVSSSIDDLGDEADATGRDMTALAANTDIAAHQIDDLGDEARMTTAELMLLERQLHSTGRAARGMDLTPDMGGLVPTGAGQAGRSFGLSFGRAGAQSMRGPLIGGLVGAAVALSPLIGAMIAGAVTGAVGVGGIAGGIASATRDPRVRAAAREFGDTISDEFFSGGTAFVQPVIDSLEILKGAFHDLDLGTAFAELAPHVTVLASGLASMLRNMMPGLIEAFRRMGPFIDALADGLGQLGTQLGDFFNRLSRSEGAVLGLESVFHLLTGSLIVLGVTIESLSNVYVRYIDFMIDATGALEDILTGPLARAVALINDALELFRQNNIQQIIPINEVGGAANRASAGVVTYADSVKIAAKHQEDLNRAMEESISNMLAQDNANLALQESLFELSESLKENGRHWDITTEKGRANRRALLDSVEAAERKRQADIRMGIQMGLSAEEATRRANIAYNKTIKKLEEMARKAGISEEALKDLVGDYYVTIHYRSTGAFYKPPSNILEQKGKAFGGPVNAGEVVRIHEQGLPEWFMPNMSGTVIPLSGMQPYSAMRSGGQTVHHVHVLDLQINGRTVRRMQIDEALGRNVSREKIEVGYP